MACKTSPFPFTILSSRLTKQLYPFPLHIRNQSHDGPPAPFNHKTIPANLPKHGLQSQNMHLSSLISPFSISLFSTTILAAPLSPRQDTITEYYLKTRTLDPSSNKNGLYVIAYHTGAGLNDVILTSDLTGASKGFLNDTYQLFDFGTEFPWGMNMGGDADHAGEFTVHPYSMALIRGSDRPPLQKGWDWGRSLANSFFNPL